MTQRLTLRETLTLVSSTLLSPFRGQEGWGKRGLFCAALFGAPALLLAGSLSTPYGELTVTNVQPGRVYIGTRDITNQPFYVLNQSDKDLDFTVEAKVPTADRLKDGYEPIPDASWITFEKDFFHAPAQGRGETDFYVSIPNDPALLGRKFQASLIVRTIGHGFMQTGLGGRMLLSIYEATSAWTDKEIANQKLGVRVGFNPFETEAKDVAPGAKTPLRHVDGKPLMLANKSEYPVECFLKVTEVSPSFVNAPVGFGPAPALGHLKLKSKRIKVAAQSETPVDAFFQFPDRPAFRGKHFYFIIEAVSTDKKTPVQKLARIFVSTAK
jgi:hypothetical protein